MYTPASVTALVLTAGLGTRLDPLTRLLAKPAVLLAGRTLVERVLAWLARDGVRDAVLNLHYMPETITGIVGDGAHLGLRVRYSWEGTILGSAGGPRHALPLIDDDPFLIVNGDTLCEIALAPLVAAHHAAGADVTMALVRNPAPDQYNGVLLDADGRVRGFVPRGSAEARESWHFVGIQVARQSVFAPLPDGVPVDTVSSLYREMVAGRTARVQGFPVSERFIDVGTPRDCLDAALALSGKTRVVEPGAQVDAAAAIDQSVIWPEATVAAGADLRRCIVAGGAKVPPGFRAESSVLLPAGLVRDGDRAEVHGGVASFQF
jgi:NDP-sugar pyrophosphorylase family protein